MNDLPRKIMVWHGSHPLPHVGSWATTRYPQEAEEYVKVAALPGMVQPLVWYDCQDGTSHDENCRYEIDPRPLSFRIIKGVTGGGSYICDASSMDDAKAAAQAHHVATILAAFGVQGGET